MKKILPLCLVSLLIISGFGAAAINLSNEKPQQTLQNNDYTHTIFAEYATATWCGYCKYAHGALKNIYAGQWHPFYYVSMVGDKNTHAYSRIKGELNLYGYPTVYFDGGYKVNVGASSVATAQAAYNSSILYCGARTVPDIDVALDVTWLGSATMDIQVTVTNNEPPYPASNPFPEDGATDMDLDVDLSWDSETAYNGRIRVYVTEVTSSMGWYDTNGDPYTFPFLEYAFNEDISITSGDQWQDSIIWDGHNYNDGYGNNFGNIQYGNIMVIAAVFNDEWHQGYAYPPSSNPFSAYYVDDTTGFFVGDAQQRGQNQPTTTRADPTFDVYFGTDPSPLKVSANQTATTYDPGTLDYETTYYWKIVTWINDTYNLHGPVWSFTTIQDPNNEPDIPTITGETNGEPGSSYLYMFSATDTDDDMVYFYIDWGDNLTEEWVGPYDSGEEIGISHAWQEEGTYTIKAKARDTHGAEGDWGTLEVTMPVSVNIPSNIIMQILQRIIQHFPILNALLEKLIL